VWDKRTEELLEKYLLLKVDPIHNTITTHRIEKKMYSRDEVESYLKDFQSALHEEHDIPTQNMGFRLRWIKENL
jgi:hypothetical protein